LNGALMPLDYSKWKKIEVSDDEDDTHPNIHTPSLFRWRHQARLERMAEAKEQREKLSEERLINERRVQDIDEKLKSLSVDDKERMKLELEMNELKKQEEEFLKKEKELEDNEQKAPWNIDTIGHEKFSSSRVNKISDQKAEPPKLSEEEENARMVGFFFRL
uniref:Probable Hsp90 co-chaperone cdc37 (inferred by orthology to a C. elegans protein) n=2 Tax=Anisakis simplex TaxID=6269 RepID=A0A0M3J7E5_ANISI